MSEKYYILRLDDPAKPGFCTFDKMYVGTEETILQVASNLEKAERYTDTVTAIRSYFKGNLDAEHNIAYRNQKVLIPIKIEKEGVRTKSWTKTWNRGSLCIPMKNG